ncbi:MAG: MgtC/SapB family protein [Chryseobacterium sp.]|nr:MAG: MgtC/SapB family protein [Chryseobacterium sp.]
MDDLLEISDVYKVLFALAAGMLLGYEREQKDKSAGLKTITIICLGSALFSMLGYKMGAPLGEPTRIASYVVSGIGFLGGGVIFKEGFSVHGLTTAGIIWISAAIGVAIGFGQFGTAGIFLVVCLLFLQLTPVLSRALMRRKQLRMLRIQLPREHIALKAFILSEINLLTRNHSQPHYLLENHVVTIFLDIRIHPQKLKDLEQLLLSVPEIEGFSF